MNHYEILGVRPGATPAELRRAYIDAARRHHPDHGGSADRMREVNEAWAVLGDRHARRAYDRIVAEARVGDPGGDDVQPFDGSDVDDAYVGGVDLRDWDDQPLGRPLAPVLVLAPAGMFVAAIGIGSMAMVLDEPALLGFAVLVFLCSLVGVAAVTLLAMRRPR